MPVGINLLFTLLMWVFSFAILFSNRSSRANRWCFITLMIFSLGVLKEYFLFDLVPYLSLHHIPLFQARQAESVYSVMTAVLYLLVMPSAFLFGLQFAGFSFRFSKRNVLAGSAMAVAAVVFTAVYHPGQFRHYQLTSELFWILISAYNLTYGIVTTVIMIRAVVREKNSVWNRQKKRVAILLLPLLWYWLITIFVIHALRITELFKVWQGNVGILAMLLVYYLIMAFREGILGIRLKMVNYNWNSQAEPLQQGAQYINHFIKNEVAKIEWCVNNLSGSFKTDPPEEIAIISRSVEHLNSLVQKVQMASKDFRLNYSDCSLYELIDGCVAEARRRTEKKIDFRVDCDKNLIARCDFLHLTETLNNLIANAVEAVGENGRILIRFCFDRRKKKYILSVEDNGTGIGDEMMIHLFEPYHTSKSGSDHFGLGLFYCNRVMRKHGGFIDVKSKTGSGTVFHLCFPKEFCVSAGSGAS